MWGALWVGDNYDEFSKSHWTENELAAGPTESVLLCQCLFNNASGAKQTVLSGLEETTNFVALTCSSPGQHLIITIRCLHKMWSSTVDPVRGLVVAALCASVLSLFYVKTFRKRYPCPLPPGPPGKFLVGNLGQLSVDHPEEDYIRWGKQYSRSLTSYHSLTCFLGVHF